MEEKENTDAYKECNKAHRETMKIYNESSKKFGKRDMFAIFITTTVYNIMAFCKSYGIDEVGLFSLEIHKLAMLAKEEWKDDMYPVNLEGED